MAKTGRNEPCACGSGRKTKRCCGTTGGPPPEQRDRAWLNSEAIWWGAHLVGYTEDDIAALADEVIELPRHDPSLHVPLPHRLPPPLERLRAATAARDMGAALPAAVESIHVIDTPALRAHLARRMLALHDDGHGVDCDLTAFVIVDLARGDPSLLLLAALVETFVAAARHRIPGGLVLAGP